MPAPYIWAKLIAQAVREPPVFGLDALRLRRLDDPHDP